MHDIEPHFKWRHKYTAESDPKSPFIGRQYSEFHYHHKIYNYYIHPQWDEFGSPTLYMKILFVDYERKYAIFELIGEWNDAVTNDIMCLKRSIIDQLSQFGINKYLVICENVLNFHGEDDDYYQEWWSEVTDSNGWVVFANLLDHVEDEMKQSFIDRYVYMGGPLNQLQWRSLKPKVLFEALEALVSSHLKYL